MRIAYRGNFSVHWTTETHVAASLESLGHEVVRIDEGELSWQDTVVLAWPAEMFLWTQTFALAHRWDQHDAKMGLSLLRERMPTVGFHLDLWFGLERAPQVADELFFTVDHLFTADGDHPEDFAALGIEHHWLPPAVYHADCFRGQRRSQFASDLAFVGNWRSYAHVEWAPHRKDMIQFLRRTYGRRIGLWPRREAVRGRDLNDLFASVKIVVGDSCFADRSHRYFSDRAFETVGRGGFLLMPYVSGLADMLEDGVHLRYFAPGDLRELRRLINYYLQHDRERAAIREAGMAHVREHHTYRNRMSELLDVVASKPAEVPA